MGNLLTKHGVVDIGMGVDMDQSDRAMLSGQRPENGQDYRVIAAQTKRLAAGLDDLVIELFNNADAISKVVGIRRHVAKVGYRQCVERRSAGAHVVGTQKSRFLANLAGAETCAAAVGGADVKRNANEGRI